MFSRFRRLNANGDVETGLGCRSTVFVYRFYANESADRTLVGLRSKTSLALDDYSPGLGNGSRNDIPMLAVVPDRPVTQTGAIRVADSVNCGES